MKFKQFNQNTNNPTWHDEHLCSTSLFFYLLRWKNLNNYPDVLKFGYKFSAIGYKRSYANINHFKPVESTIWTTNLIQEKSPEFIIHEGLLKNSIKQTEVIIHKKFKKELKFKTISSYREYYKNFNINYAIELINLELGALKSNNLATKKYKKGNI